MAIREIDNGYYVEVFLGTNPVTGKKNRKTKTFKPKNRITLKEAKAWEVTTLEDFEKGSLNLKGNVALETYLNEWFESSIEGKKAYNTVKRYKVLKNCIIEHLGKVKLNKLVPKMIDDFYNGLCKEMITLKNGTTKRRYSDGTILKVHKLFKLALDQAVKWQVVANNVVLSATPPPDNKPNRNAWDINTINDFLEFIKGEQIYLPTLIAYHTGLREGEICALRWSDINLKEGYIAVNHNIVEVKGDGLVLDNTKTDSSKANVAMTENLKSVLESVLLEHKKHKLKTKIKLEYVCGWNDGRALRPTYVSKTFTKFARKFSDEKEIEKITFHGLRHSHASILYSLGSGSQEISQRLRHSRVSTTDDIYIHINEEIKKSTAQVFDKAIDSAK